MNIKKKNTVYLFIFIIWGILSIFGVRGFINNINAVSSVTDGIIVFILIINTIFIVYFWLNGTKDIVYVFFYYIKQKKRLKEEDKLLAIPLDSTYQNAKVFLLYCTCNDFIGESLLESMKQTHPHIQTYILDDSSDPEYLEKIDAFAKEHHITVVRRENREGFKAGNLNHFLDALDENAYDYFVILDSDEIIPPDFVEKALHYFAYYKNMGILQATHISTRNKNEFMNRFSIGVDSHWPTYQTVKESYGFLSLLGHGAMISHECYATVGGFPLLVAEDICFTIEARLKGYFAGFSNRIICQEEYPIDYFAFKKRHLKWTGGNLEFIKTYSSKIIKSKDMTWYEKIDVILFTYSLPLSSVFFIFLSINLIILPVMGYSAGYPLWLMTPTTIYLLSPMINDFITLMGKISPLKYCKYFVSTFCLYGSLYWLSFFGASKAWLGIKPVFIVTPKDEQEYTVKEMLLGNMQEILFSIVLIIISVVFTHSLLPVILIVTPSLSGYYLTLLSKRKVKKSEPEKEDNEEKEVKALEEKKEIIEITPLAEEEKIYTGNR